MEKVQKNSVSSVQKILHLIGKITSVYCGNVSEHMNAFCLKMQTFMLKQVVHVVTTGFKVLNKNQWL
jgi:hypothetical protein